MKTVSDEEAKADLPRLLERAHSGEEVIIVKAGQPYARLGPLTSPARRVPGLLSGKLDDSFFDPLPEDELAAWER